MILIDPTFDFDRINKIFKLKENTNSLYFIIHDGNEDLGLFELQELTKITGILHLHIKPEHQQKNIAIQSVEKLLKYIKILTSYKNLIGTIPESNKHIMSVVNKTDSKCCGIIKNGIIREDELQDLLLFQLEVK